ncbi:sensor histidine kinase [Pseudoduganella namucuonensis]|uniref:sensor histidine kinase n=1 Tax=Pseudoduganella namucuonensis TaxID=1035707 RepID=UPI0015A61EBE|nr:HAMP domain-containing sensor histidine kinase [Pseudoduganella namucuonensis]
MSNLEPPAPSPPAPPPATSEPAALHTVHTAELTRLRDTIDELLLLVHQQNAEKQQLLLTLATQVPRLREANEHLILATFGAQDMQNRAETANRRQSEFMAMLAHELRNPLQPVAVANELIGRLSGAHPDLPRLHAVIQRQTSHMARLVDDLLDVGRMRAGKLTIAPQSVTLADILDAALETTLPLFERRRQAIRLALPDVPVRLTGDMVRLTQVFSNLLINASKFTGDGGAITVTAELQGGMVEIHVEDNGAGIPLALQPRIFDLFTQGEIPHDQVRAGLGIGLALVRAICELHGGSAGVHSAGPGLGSRFTVSLPAHASHAPE